jgi:hypothetical protein
LFSDIVILGEDSHEEEKEQVADDIQAEDDGHDEAGPVDDATEGGATEPEKPAGEEGEEKDAGDVSGTLISLT